MATIHEIIAFLNSTLEVTTYDDVALNGLQVEACQEVDRIAFAVDAGLSIIEQAAIRRCQLLVTHHGIFWGKIEPITGTFGRKIKRLMDAGLSLYAAHLPLDGHETLGNAAQLAQQLKLRDIEPCFYHKEQPIGVRASFSKPRPLVACIEELARFDGALQPPFVLPFGKQEISTIGIATGSATSFIIESASLELDLFVTGEAKQEAYHVAKEHACSVICMGHYASETFGVRALQRVLAERFQVQTEWISEPTGI